MFRTHQPTLDDMLSRVKQADEAEINAIIRAVIERYGEAFPGWEVMFLSLPKDDPELRRKTADGICALLKQSSQ